MCCWIALRKYAISIVIALVATAADSWNRSGAEPPQAAPTVTLARGDLTAILRDNSQSRRLLSGVASLVHQKASPDFNAFDRGPVNGSGGLNFEHITGGHKNPHNAFSPRSGVFSLVPLPGGASAMLVRDRKDDPWGMSYTIKYTLAAPHYVDVDFRCIAHDRALFGQRGYAALFFANYMNDVQSTAIHFRGIEAAAGPEKWIEADAPQGHPDWMRGGTYRSAQAAPLAYDADHNFKINLWSYDYPRFTRPFYYGRAAHDMVLILMFNKTHTAEDEIRFSDYKFKLPQFPRPAWDFGYVIRNIQENREYGFQARLVWKKFVSAEDCLREYVTWSAAMK